MPLDGPGAAVLGAEHGIGVRNGCCRAHPYLARLLGLGDADAPHVRADLRSGNRSAVPGMVRISFGHYNSAHDIGALVAALGCVARGEHGGDYQLDRRSGEFSAAGWNPRLELYFRLGAARQGVGA